MNHNIAIRKSTNAFGAKKTTSDLQTVVAAMTIHCPLQATDQDGCCLHVVCRMVGSVSLCVDFKLD